MFARELRANRQRIGKGDGRAAEHGGDDAGPVVGANAVEPVVLELGAQVDALQFVEQHLLRMQKAMK